LLKLTDGWLDAMTVGWMDVLMDGGMDGWVEYVRKTL
jgi:hypothetical protein